jgi:biotin synthase-related radical SAM superfamily protein
MKRINLIVMIVFAALLITNISILAQDKEHATHSEHKVKSIDLKAVDGNEDGKVYQCSMCADQLSDKAGNCEMCKMKLTEVSLADAKGNLEKKDFKVMDHESGHEHGKEHMMTASKMDVNKDGKVYQCTMCPSQISDEAGNCEMCKMKLKEVSVDDAQKNMPEADKKMGVNSSHKCSADCAAGCTG